MATLNRDPTAPAPPPLELRAACAHDELVHLTPVRAHIPAQRTLCSQPVEGRTPERLLEIGGCRRCADRALELGVTFALDAGAIVNLERLRRWLQRH